MGTVNFDTNVEKTVEIAKTVTLDVNKEVTSFVTIAGNLATAEASADAVGTPGGPVDEGIELVDMAGGLSRGDIHAEWWDRALNFPTGTPSFTETDGALQAVGQDVPGVFLVDGFSTGGEVTRSFAVGYGDTLAIPLVNFFFLATDPAEDPVQEVANSAATVDVDLLRLSVDGEEVPLSGLTNTPTGVFDITVEPGGFLDNFFDPGETFDAAADGYFVLLDGLDPGPHEVEFGYFDDDGIIEDGEVKVTADILVLQSEGTLAETDTFAQVTPDGAFSFSESLVAVNFVEVDDFAFVG